jgi:hypothetical protein
LSVVAVTVNVGLGAADRAMVAEAEPTDVDANEFVADTGTV